MALIIRFFISGFKEEKKMNWKHDRKLMIFMLLLLFIPLSGNLLFQPKTFSALENRMLSDKVLWDKDLLKSGILAERVERFVQDQFPLREIFINLKSDVQVVLGKEENNGVYLGKDDYLFEKAKKYDEKILRENIDAVNELNTRLEGKLNVLVVPPSSLINDDKLPAFADTEKENTQFQYIQNHLQMEDRTDLHYLFMMHKKENVYFRTDHHWTQYGAYLAYRELMNSFSMTPVDNTDFTVHKTSGFLGTYYSKFRGSFTEPEEFVLYESETADLEVEYIGENRVENRVIFKENLDLYDKYKAYLDGNYPLIRIRNANQKNDRKILVLKDSFANAMVPYLSESFSEVHYLDLRYYNLSLKEYIEKEHFDEVILIYGMNSFGEETSLKKLAY